MTVVSQTIETTVEHFKKHRRAGFNSFLIQVHISTHACSYVHMHRHAPRPLFGSHFTLSTQPTISGTNCYHPCFLLNNADIGLGLQCEQISIFPGERSPAQSLPGQAVPLTEAGGWCGVQGGIRLQTEHFFVPKRNRARGRFFSSPISLHYEEGRLDINKWYITHVRFHNFMNFCIRFLGMP